MNLRTPMRKPNTSSPTNGMARTEAMRLTFASRSAAPPTGATSSEASGSGTGASPSIASRTAQASSPCDAFQSGSTTPSASSNPNATSPTCIDTAESNSSTSEPMPISTAREKSAWRMSSAEKYVPHAKHNGTTPTATARPAATAMEPTAKLGTARARANSTNPPT